MPNLTQEQLEELKDTFNACSKSDEPEKVKCGHCGCTFNLYFLTFKFCPLCRFPWLKSEKVVT